MPKENKEKVNWKERFEALKISMEYTWNASKSLTAVIFFITILGGLLTIATPYIFKLIIDEITNEQTFTLGAGIALGIAGILIMYGVVRIIESIFWDVQSIIKRMHSQRIDRYATNEMMKKVSSLDAIYFEKPEYYNEITKANQNVWRVNEFFWQFTYFIGQLISVLVIIGALWLFDFRIVILIVASILPSIILMFKSTQIVWSAFSSDSPIFRQAHYYRGLMIESAEAIREIKLFKLRPHFMNKFDELFTEFMKKQERAAWKEFFVLIFIGIAEGILAVIAAWLVVQGFLQGEITIGEFTFLWALLFQFADHARWMVRMIGEMNSNATFTTPLVRINKFKPQIREPLKPVKFPQKLKHGIEFKNVTFYYPGSKTPALSKVSFTIKPGESVSLVGENGSGKTTLIKLLTRLYDVTEGEILIDGINIKKYSLEDLHNNIGVIFQDFMKYEALVEENIGFGRLEEINKREKVHKASVKSEAWEFIKELDKKYRTHLGKTLKEEGTELSVGQWQKIALARAFFKDAQLLILDEPTAAVDAKAEYKLFQKFRNLTKNKTTILISHRFSTVRMADEIIVIHRGKITEKGSHRELLRKNGLYSKLFRLQAEGYK